MLDSRRARLDRHLRPARHRRRAGRLGERGAPGARSEARRRQVRDRRCRPISILAEPPVARGRQGWSTGTARARWRRPISSSSTRRRRRSSTAKNFYRPRDPAGRARDTRREFPQIPLVTIDRLSAAGTQGAGDAFADGGVFDQIYHAGPAMSSVALPPPGRSPLADAMPARLRPGARRSRSSICSADRADPARGADAGDRGELGLGAVSGRWSPSRACSTSLRALLRRLAGAARRQRGRSACSSPGCWCATSFPAGGCSTRWSTCRSRCRPPSPASRSPRSTRRTAGSARLLAAARHQGRLHAARRSSSR